MFTDDVAYKQLPEFVKHYSLAQHLIDISKEKYQHPNSWRKRLCESLIAIIFVRAMEYYWENLAEQDFSIVDVGSQYGVFSLVLAKYIKTSGNINKIYAFDCGIAGKLTDRNIKLNQLDNLIKFEYKAVCNVSTPQLVYYDPQHSEDNHIVKRNFVNLPSYVVEGITLDDYFKNNNTSTRNLMIKIDAQGVEPLIFKGMQKILQLECRPLIVFEFIPWVCKSIVDPVEFLNGLPEGYIVFNIDDTSEEGLQKIERSNFAHFVNKISTKKPPYTDLLILHEKSVIDSDILIDRISEIFGSDLYSY